MRRPAFLAQVLLPMGCLTFVSAPCLVGQTARLSDSTRRIVFDGAAFSTATALPQWSQGYLASRQVETFQPGSPNVWLYDRSGALLRQAAIWFPGSQRVLIYSVTATPKGEIIASGKAEKSDGEAAPFIALTNLNGNPTRVIQTMDFGPMNICGAPDGTVWSFGGTGYDQHAQPNPGNTLRNFDFAGGELSSYLPRSTFAPKLHPGPEVKAYIRCLSDEVIVYSPSARQFVELTYGTGLPQIHQVGGIPSDLRLTGFAAIDSRRIYGNFSYGATSGLYYLSFDPSGYSVTWQSVAGTVGKYPSPGVITGLWGADGDQLLVSRSEDRAGTMAIHWASPQK